MIIIVGHEKGGVGKSQIAINLAAYLQKSLNKKVVLVDTDTQRTSSKWGAVRDENQREEEQRLKEKEEKEKSKEKSRASSKASAQPKPVDPKEEEKKQGPFNLVEKTIDPAPAIVKLSGEYDAVVVDVGARDYARLSDLAKIADVWIAPTRVGQGDLESTTSLAHAFSELHHKHKDGHIPLYVVVNAVPATWNSSEGEEAIEALRALLPTGDVLSHSIRDRRIWRDAHRLGKTIFDMPEILRKKAQAEFVAVINEILPGHDQTTEE